MASSQILKNANGNVVALENPDTNFSNKTIDISKLEDNLGIGQTWQDVTSSRSSGVTYTNNTGKPIEIAVHWYIAGASNGLEFTVDGVVVGQSISGGGNSSDTGIGGTVTFVVPVNSTYSTIVSYGSPSLRNWSELR